MHLFAAGAGRGSRPGTRRPQAGHLRAPPCPSGLAAPTPLRGPGLPRAAAPPRGTLLPAGAMGDAPKHGPHRPPQSHCPKASGASMGRVIPWGTQGRGDFDSSLLFRTHRMVPQLCKGTVLPVGLAGFVAVPLPGPIPWDKDRPCLATAGTCNCYQLFPFPDHLWLLSSGAHGSDDPLTM